MPFPSLSAGQVAFYNGQTGGIGLGAGSYRRIFKFDGIGLDFPDTPGRFFRIAGRYLVRGGKAVAIAGDWQPGRIVIMEFPPMEQMRNCFPSPEYAHL